MSSQLGADVGSSTAGDETDRSSEGRVELVSSSATGETDACERFFSGVTQVWDGLLLDAKDLVRSNPTLVLLSE